MLEIFKYFVDKQKQNSNFGYFKRQEKLRRNGILISEILNDKVLILRISLQRSVHFVDTFNQIRYIDIITSDDLFHIPLLRTAMILEIRLKNMQKAGGPTRGNLFDVPTFVAFRTVELTGLG